MHNFLDLLLYRHRRFKGQTYYRHHLPLTLIVNVIISALVADSLVQFSFLLILFLSIDIVLALGAWLFYKEDL